LAAMPSGSEAMQIKGLPPLAQACALGDRLQVQKLIDGGADLNQRNDDGNSAVWLCCYSNSVEILELLAYYGADLNNQNKDGATALVYASSAGKTEVVRTLLALGADTALVTEDGFTALDIAASRPVLKLLRQTVNVAERV